MSKFLGTLKVPSLASAPGSPVAGQVYYDTTLVAMYVYNGTAWVAASPQIVSVLSSASVSEVGVSGQNRAGRELVAADFTTLLGLTTPIGLWDAGSLTNLGSGGNLTNKGTVALTAKGIAGTANHAALFTGSTAQALYIADTGAADPFRLKTGSYGCWFRTAKRGTTQALVSKWGGAVSCYLCYVGNDNRAGGLISIDGTASTGSLASATDVADDRWHFMVMTFDGSVHRLYVDGVLEASVAVAGTIFSGSAPFNIGGQTADGSTVAANPHYGRIAVPFVTPDVLSGDQIRLLYCAKAAHGYTGTPTRSYLSVRRKRKGGPLVTGDFSATPKVLYNFTAGALTDAGSLGTTLTNNSTAVSVAGVDGQTGGAFQFNGTSQYLSGTDTGLPATTAVRSMGAWFRTTGASATQVVSVYGTAAGNANFILMLNSAGLVFGGDSGGTNVATTVVPYNDGQWHFAVTTYDGSAADGLKIKLYVDGKLGGSSTAAITSTTLAGANAFRLGAYLPGTLFFGGGGDGAFITDYAMAQDEVSSLYAKGSVALGPSDYPAGESIEAYDSTNVYYCFDALETQHAVDLKVT